MRICKNCNMEKPITGFYKHSCGFCHTCKNCYKDRAKKWAAENKERRLEIVKKSRENSNVWADYRNKWKSLNGQSAEARAMKWKRTPKWITKDDLWLIREAYSLAKLREKLLGIKWHVDHIIPLRGKTVCGLHVPYNIQVIPAVINLKKSNMTAFSTGSFTVV